MTPSSDLAADPERGELLRVLQGLDVTAREAEVLVVLLELGSAAVPEIARTLGVERPNLYRVLDGLVARRLVEPVLGEPRAWVSPPRDELVNRLLAQQDERHRAVHAAGERARQLLDRLGPAARSVQRGVMQQIPGVTAVMVHYDRLLDATTGEFLVCNQGPYGGVIIVKPSVLEALNRGVRARALYEAHELTDPEAQALRDTREAYHSAGVEGRLIPRVPFRVAIFDRRAVLFATPDPSLPEGAFPTNYLVEDESFASFAALAFEQLWASATPYPDPGPAEGRALGAAAEVVGEPG